MELGIVTTQDRNELYSMNLIKAIGKSKLSRTESNFYFGEALKIAEEMGDKNKQVICLVSLSMNNNELKNYPVSIKYLEIALRMAEVIQLDDITLLNIYMQYSIAYEGLKKPKQAVLQLEKALTYAEKIGNKQNILFCQMAISFNYIHLNEYWKCIQHLESALPLAEVSGNRELLSSCFQGLGVVYNYQFEYQKGITYLEKALPLKIELEDKFGLSECYLSLSSANNNLSKYLVSIAYLDKALPLKIELGDKMGESSCYVEYGISHKGVQQYQKAIAYLDKALPLKIELGHKMGECECYTNLGLVYFNLSDYQRAIEYLEKALNIAQKIDSEFEKSVCYTNLGLVYFNLSDYQKAIMFLEKALEIKINIADKMGEATCYGNLGNFYHQIGNYHQARQYYLKTLEIAKQFGDQEMELNAYLNISNTYLDYSRLNGPESSSYLNKAFNIAKETNNNKAFMHIFATRGKLNTTANEYQNAKGEFEKSLIIAEQIGDKNMQMLMRISIGVCYSELGQSNHAIEEFQKSLIIAKGIGNEERISFILANLGMLMFQLKKFDQSYSLLQEAITKSEKVGIDLLDNEYKIHYYGKNIVVYHYMILNCIHLKKIEEAYQYVRKSKSKALLELMTTSNIRPKTNDLNITNHIKEEQELLYKKKLIQNEFLRRNSNTHYGNVNSDNVTYEELELINKKLDKIYSKLEELNPEYVYLRKFKEISINELQESISGTNIIIIEYYSIQDQFYIFTISKNKFDITIVQFNNKMFSEIIKNYVDEVINYPEFITSGKLFVNKWKDLSKFLLEPVEEYLKDMEIVYLIPHHVLHYFPLHALELNGVPLIKKVGVVFLQNIGLLRFFRNKEHRPITNCLAVGLYSGNESLFFSKEAKEIARNYNSTALIDAPKSTILGSINKDLLHFATHGNYNPDNPLLSQLVLNNKERLTAGEIFNLEINAELVTLSACESGLNKYHLGDEMVGLVRAFTYAGAGSIMVSLWKVYDPSTYEFMMKFYRNLQKGMSKVTALQDAQIRLMESKTYSHSYFWAPFILVGNWL